MSGDRASRTRALLAGFVLAAVVVTASGTVPPAAADAGIASAPIPGQSDGAEAAALAAARSIRSEVEVAGSKSESARVVATPQGTLVHESYAVPRWTRKSDGGWREIDTRLRAGGAGGVAPIATLADVRFSSGGTGPAATVPVAGGEVSISWFGALPTPQIVGDTAVYGRVLDGVDLHLRALVDGFTWSLVVHSAQAAENPALETLRFGLSATGVGLRSRTGGGFEAFDGSGSTVLSTESALMWDSAGVAPQARSTDLREAPGGAGTADGDEVTRVAPDGSRKAELPTTLTDSELVVTPDQDLLRGADTVFPVVIDPATTINKSRWAYAGSTNATRSDGIARVGRDPEGSGTYRSFFAFNVSGLQGKEIQSVNFSSELTHSWSCTATPVNLWRTASLANPGKVVVVRSRSVGASAGALR